MESNMPDWLMSVLSGLQRTAVSGLAAELRAGGMSTGVLAFALGALHALTPGHGKAALTAYFLGQEARLGTGLRVALTASLLHVAMGALAFVVLRFLIGQMPSMTARGSPFFVVTGYGLILLAGVVMVVQSLRPSPAAMHPHMLTIGVGLLPCPLTVTVLGFAWAQGAGPMVAVVLIALAAGIAFTIGAVALLAIILRRSVGRVLAHRLSGFERGARMLQGVAGVAIVVIAAAAVWVALRQGRPT
jgi:ABC-type nickel/cobalt efflux system permease component RcnA